MAAQVGLGPEVREALVALGLAAATVRLYVKTIERAERWMGDRGASLVDAPASLVAEYVETQPSGWSNRNLMRAALGHYWAITERPSPPVRALRVPPKPEGVCKALDEDDARIMVKYCHAIAESGDRRGLALMLGFYTALRRAEIAAVSWSDFTLGNLRVIGKFRKDATLPVHSRLVPVLDAWPGPHRGHLFAGKGRPHVNPMTVWQWSLDVAEEAGVPERVPTHRLRHTALATANDNTGDLRATSELARHTKVQTTMIYTRTKAQRLKETVESIDY